MSLLTHKILTHLSLFSGIGGIDLAAERAGFHTVGQCELADFPTQVLEKHWPNMSRWRDIRDVTKESFYEKTGLRTVTLISGGFPCTPFSVAGKQKGKEDSRYLWPEMLRVIRELAPHYVLGENVPGILRLAGRTVCEDLEREGYSVAVFNFEAAAVGAPHRRDRMFFVAHANSDTRGAWRPEPAGQQRQTRVAESSDVLAYTRCTHGQGHSQCGFNEQAGRQGNAPQFERPSEVLGTVANTEGIHAQGQHDRQREIQPRRSCGGQPQSRVCRMVNELSQRVDEVRLTTKSPCVNVDTEQITGGGSNQSKQEIRPRKILCLLQDEDSKEVLQRDTGEYEYFFKEEALQCSMCWLGSPEGDSQSCRATETCSKTQRGIVFEMRDNQKPGCAPQGRESCKQYGKQHNDSLRGLPHKNSLGRRESPATEEIQFLLYSLWQACTDIGYVPETLSEIQEVWRSLSDENKDWVTLRIATGNPWVAEWQGVPRTTTGQKDRANRLKALGNAVVPAQVYPILRAIAIVERMNT